MLNDRRGIRRAAATGTAPWVLNLISLISMGILIAAGTAEAQPAALPTLGLGLHGGAFEPQDADGFSPSGGVHLRFRFSALLGLEGSVDVGEADFPGGRSALQVPVQMSVLVYGPRVGAIEPYALGGLGLYFFQLDTPGTPSRDTAELGYHAGLGMAFPLGSSWVLDVDGRYYALADNLDGGFASDGWQARVGVTFYFEQTH